MDWEAAASVSHRNCRLNVSAQDELSQNGLDRTTARDGGYQWIGTLGSSLLSLVRACYCSYGSNLKRCHEASLPARHFPSLGSRGLNSACSTSGHLRKISDRICRPVRQLCRTPKAARQTETSPGRSERVSWEYMGAGIGPARKDINKVGCSSDWPGRPGSSYDERMRCIHRERDTLGIRPRLANFTVNLKLFTTEDLNENLERTVWGWQVRISKI